MQKNRFNLLVKKALILQGKVKAAASKSYTTRAIIIGGLSKKTVVLNPLICEDTNAAIKTFQDLGARIKKEPNKVLINGFGGNLNVEGKSINVGESGTLLRLVLSVLALAKGRCIVNGEKTLLKRSNLPIGEALRSLGVKIKGRDEEFRLPIIIEGKGGIPGGKVVVSGRMSSQTISSLLNVAPFAQKDTTIIVKDRLVSRPYIDINIDALKTAGIKVRELTPNKFFIQSRQRLKENIIYNIHGDYSSAAFLIAAACLVKSQVTIIDLVKDSQGDREIINILNRMGAKIGHINASVIIKGPFDLKGIDINCRNTPDLVPVLCVMGCFAKGKTRIQDIGHLAYKETDRITSPAVELAKLGAEIKVHPDGLLIKESKLRPGCVSSAGDHRIAMALAVAGLRIGNLVIQDVGCIRKSYPNFISDLRSLGANLIIR